MLIIDPHAKRQAVTTGSQHQLTRALGPTVEQVCLAAILQDEAGELAVAVEKDLAHLTAQFPLRTVRRQR